jgi:hypothetical protein
MTVSYDPSPDDEPDVSNVNPAMHLSWKEILEARADEKLQRRGWKRFRPEDDLSAAARTCPGCGRPASALAWVYFTNEPDCWMSECGLEGWIVACMDCRKQADFFPTLLS